MTDTILRMRRSTFRKEAKEAPCILERLSCERQSRGVDPCWPDTVGQHRGSLTASASASPLTDEQPGAQGRMGVACRHSSNLGAGYCPELLGGQ